MAIKTETEREREIILIQRNKTISVLTLKHLFFPILFLHSTTYRCRQKKNHQQYLMCFFSKRL